MRTAVKSQEGRSCLLGCYCRAQRPLVASFNSIVSQLIRYQLRCSQGKQFFYCALLCSTGYLTVKQRETEFVRFLVGFMWTIFLTSAICSAGKERCASVVCLRRREGAEFPCISVGCALLRLIQRAGGNLIYFMKSSGHQRIEAGEENNGSDWFSCSVAPGDRQL